MAGQDFAHNTAPSRQDTDKPARSASILPAVAVLCVAGACFAGGYWLGAGDIQQTGNKKDVEAMEAHLAIKEANIKIQQVRIETLEGLVKQWKAKANEDAHSKVGELSFYKDLPKQSVMPAAPVSATKPAAIKVKKATHSIAKPRPAIKPITAHTPQASSHAVTHTANQANSSTHTYRIQIASFRSRSDAVPMQQNLIKIGLPAFIHSVDLAAKGQWFRVYAGPFASKALAKEQQQNIEQKMHINGFLQRER